MGRPLKREEKTRDRQISVTDTAWTGMDTIATQLGIPSKSGLIEAIGRGEVIVVKADASLAERFAAAVALLTVLAPDVRKALGDGPKKTGP